MTLLKQKLVKCFIYPPLPPFILLLFFSQKGRYRVPKTNEEVYSTDWIGLDDWMNDSGINVRFRLDGRISCCCCKHGQP